MTFRLIYLFVLQFHVLGAIGASGMSDLKVSVSDRSVADAAFVCTNVMVDRPAKVSSILMILKYDDTKLSYRGPINQLSPDLVVAANFSGGLNISYDQGEHLTIGENKVVVGLCFDVINRSDGIDEADISIVDVPTIRDADGIDYNLTTDDGIITINNRVDCDLIGDVCIGQVTVNYEGQPIDLFPEDFLNVSLDDFLACNKLNRSEVKIANLSAQDFELTDMLSLTCGELKDDIYIGLFREEEGGVSSVGSICIVHVSIGGLSAYPSCVTDLTSIYEPNNCKDLSLSADEDGLVIPLDDLSGIPLGSGPVFLATSGVTSSELSYDVMQGPDTQTLSCEALNEENTYDFAMVIPIVTSPEYSRAVFIDNFCTSIITIDNWSESCGRDDFSSDGVSVELLNNQDLTPQLNGRFLARHGVGKFTFTIADLLDGQNEITIPGQDLINGMTTLDLVYVLLGLIKEDLSSTRAIAADFDFSGSVSTKDLYLMQRIILGIDAGTGDAIKYFLVEESEDLSTLDPNDFENHFYTYSFDNSEVQADDQLKFEVFARGDVSEAISDIHKSDIEDAIPSVVNIENRYVRKGEKISVQYDLNSIDDYLIAGVGWRLLHPHLQLRDVHTAIPSSSLKWNANGSGQTTLSFLSQEGVKHLDVEVTFMVTEDGYLEDMLSLDKTFTNEQVGNNYSAHPMVLQFTDEEIDIKQPIIYPNPVSDQLQVQLPFSESGYQLSIYNSVGQLLDETTSFESHHIISRDVLGHSGIKMLTIVGDGERYVQKIVVR